MTVVHVPRRFTTAAWGGTETVVLETAKRLQATGHRTEILCPRALAESDLETIEGVRVRRFPYFYPYLGLAPDAVRRLDQKGGNLFSFELMRALRDYPGLDLIHLHTGKRLGGIGRLVALARGIPYVVTLHGGLHDVPADEARTWTEPTAGAWEWGKALGWAVGSRRVIDDAAAVLCLGPEEAARTRAAHPGANVLLLPNGVDADRFAAGDGARFRRERGLPRGAPVLLVVGRIDPQKGQRLAVKVLARLATARADLRLVLAGPVTNDAYAEALARDIRDLDLGHRVVRVDALPAGSPVLADAYAAADVCLVPSVHEPFGIVVLEAWAAGKPVVASRVGGLPSFVEDGRDGLLVPPGEAATWAAAVDALLDDPARRRDLGAAGGHKARGEYSWDAVTRRLAGIYEACRSDRRHAAAP